LGFRILTVREHLANEVCEFLPEMVRTGILQSNLQLRCEQLERMTQVDEGAIAIQPPDDLSADPDGTA
jgi:hypothetical protein